MLKFEPYIKAYLRDIVGSVPEHCNKLKIAIKRVTQFFFPVPRKPCLHHTVAY